MFVTSDIFDLERIGRFRHFDWHENLLMGIAVKGTQWPGYKAGAKFVLTATQYLGLTEEMLYAGYNRPGEVRTRPISPNSFPRLADGRLTGAKDAASLLFRGDRAALGARNGSILFGGHAARQLRHTGELAASRSLMVGPDREFSSNYIAPIVDNWLDVAKTLLKMTVDMLGSEYGYFFIRDDLGFPLGYPSGIAGPMDYGPLCRDNAREIGDWYRFASRDLWGGDWPRLRDLFQVNLLSERHTSRPIEGLGYLTDWISAGRGRGELEDAGKGRVLWILDDAGLFNVRPILNQAGILLSCRNRVYRDLRAGQNQ